MNNISVGQLKAHLKSAVLRFLETDMISHGDEIISKMTVKNPPKGVMSYGSIVFDLTEKAIPYAPSRTITASFDSADMYGDMDKAVEDAVFQYLNNVGAESIALIPGHEVVKSGVGFEVTVRDGDIILYNASMKVPANMKEGLDAAFDQAVDLAMVVKYKRMVSDRSFDSVVI
ncbi:hypothetical protein PQC06_gp078 [Aeromonas phage LAh10]|uniref:Uncharacterized protein n=1 Tax=Aeromonas phage LAh10 TaxID=2591025 RepID=A0A514A1L4_9CAUD|nr:hypothetical protein PQC06_gp078 [Aeromonas phage LAh10]QDH47164.1 hypothetical protein LAh10_78 [Aeromonas phage LAh10]